MEIFKTQKDLDLYLDSLRLEGNKIALVPTMGGLHDGHLSLVDKAKSLSEIVVVSIFVNPTQFARGEDFDDYPNTFEADKLLLESKNVDALFLPSKEEIYPHGTYQMSGILDMHLHQQKRLTLIYQTGTPQRLLILEGHF